MYEGWCGGLVRKLIMAADEDSVWVRRTYGFQRDLQWKSELKGVTVIGEGFVIGRGTR